MIIVEIMRALLKIFKRLKIKLKDHQLLQL